MPHIVSAFAACPPALAYMRVCRAPDAGSVPGADRPVSVQSLHCFAVLCPSLSRQLPCKMKSFMQCNQFSVNLSGPSCNSSFSAVHNADSITHSFSVHDRGFKAGAAAQYTGCRYIKRLQRHKSVTSSLAGIGHRFFAYGSLLLLVPRG